MAFVANVATVHAQVHDNLQLSSAKYKASADHHRRDSHFKVGDFVQAVLTRDRFSLGDYNKLKSRKVGPLEVLEKINANLIVFCYHQMLVILMSSMSNISFR